MTVLNTSAELYSFPILLVCMMYTNPYCAGDREDDYGSESKARSTLESASNDVNVAAQFKNEIQAF